MARYVPLFFIAAKHDFFADGICRALSFAPDAKTAAWLDRSDLLAKPTPDGIGVFCTDDRREVLRGYVSGGGGGIVLRFEVFAKNADFCQYTLPTFGDPTVTLRLDSRDAVADETGLRLHKDPYVSEASFAGAEGCGLRRPPLMVVEIQLTADDLAAGDGATAAVVRRYYLRFEPRRTYWKYYVLGDLAKRNPYIADLGGELEFERVDAPPELGDRSALVYLSRTPLPMRDVPVQRLQLRGREGVAEKVLIKRLPNADTGRLGKGRIEGREVLVSEIFVNQ